MFFHCNSSEFSANIRSIATANEETLLWKTLLPDLLPYIFSHLCTHPRFVSGNCFCLSVSWKFSETFCFRTVAFTRAKWTIFPPLRTGNKSFTLLCCLAQVVLLMFNKNWEIYTFYNSEGKQERHLWYFWAWLRLPVLQLLHRHKCIVTFLCKTMESKKEDRESLKERSF